MNPVKPVRIIYEKQIVITVEHEEIIEVPESLGEYDVRRIGKDRLERGIVAQDNFRLCQNKLMELISQDSGKVKSISFNCDE
jgi:hypothetical protein